MLVTYRVVGIFREIQNQSFYNLSVMDIIKDTKRNKIKGLTISRANRRNIPQKKGLSENILDAKKCIGEGHKFRVISDEKDFIPHSEHTPIFGIKNEHELIKGYTDVFNNIRFKNRMIGRPQGLKDGAGIYIDSTKDKTRFRIDIETIETVTVAMMWAIHVVAKDRGVEMIEAIDDFYSGI